MNIEDFFWGEGLGQGTVDFILRLIVIVVAVFRKRLKTFLFSRSFTA